MKKSAKARIAIFFMVSFAPCIVFAQTTQSRVVLSVPFTSQAPAGNWAEPWQDFCEEASSVMAAHFVWNLPLSPRTAEAEMQIMWQYEKIMYHGRLDISADETADILRKLYGLQRHVTVRPVGSAADIKREIANGRIVILPAAGRMLDNPHFKSPPLYHMVVVAGFDNAKNIFITNDPGTRFGASFPYNQQKLFAAIHDWNNGDVLHGEKKMIVVVK